MGSELNGAIIPSLSDLDDRCSINDPIHGCSFNSGLNLNLNSDGKNLDALNFAVLSAERK